jgi:hypothetical protein
MNEATEQATAWPGLPLAQWQPCFETLHRFTQIVGKIRLAQSPWTNHSWHVPLYLSARGLTSSVIAHGERAFEIRFDFIAHRLLIDASSGEQRSFALAGLSVQGFDAAIQAELAGLGLAVSYDGRPNELETAEPFASDTAHCSYDAGAAHRLWLILLQADRVFKRFRAEWIGKASPVHFFWGSFDLAVTRFSGRRAPPHPGGVPHLPDWVAREAYSHELSSAGFWPGGGPHPFPLIYSYAYPEPAGFAEAHVEPAEAFYSDSLKEFILPYDAVRTAADPDAALLAFLRTTYEAAADRAAWPRADLERPGAGFEPQV